MILSRLFQNWEKLEICGLVFRGAATFEITYDFVSIDVE